MASSDKSIDVRVPVRTAETTGRRSSDWRGEVKQRETA